MRSLQRVASTDKTLTPRNPVLSSITKNKMMVAIISYSPLGTLTPQSNLIGFLNNWVFTMLLHYLNVGQV